LFVAFSGVIVVCSVNFSPTTILFLSPVTFIAVTSTPSTPTAFDIFSSDFPSFPTANICK